MKKQMHSIPDHNARGRRKTMDYAKVAQLLNTGRNAKKCRDRWQNFLRDGIKKGAWTADEEQSISEMYSIFGPK
jgi:Myb-like DNA-binding domain